MRFLNPAGLWLLLGVPVLIIIYLIKSQHEDRQVSSTYIWQLSSKFMKKRLPMQKIKKLLTFLIQLTVIISIALIAARPAIENGNICEYILIIDSSASMQIKDNTGTSRFEYAVSSAQAFTSEMEKGHRISLITADDTAAYQLQSSTSQSELKLALKNLKCSNGGCNAEEAISLAKLLCDRVDNAKVIFFTDKEYEKTDGVDVINLNNNEWNVSFTSLSAKKEGKNTVFTGKLTSYNQGTTLTVGLKIDGKITDAQIIDCEQDKETVVSFTSEGLASYDTAEVFIETSDALDIDNSFAICNKKDRTYTVTLVSASPLYLESALNALGNCKLSVASTIEEATLEGQDLYIFDGIYPENYPTDGSVIQFGTEKLPEGISAGAVINEEKEISINTSLTSDVYESLALRESVVSEYTALLCNAYWEKLLLCEKDAVLACRKLDSGMTFSVFSFDVHNTNLPLQMDFPVLIRNIVEFSTPALLKDTDFSVGESVTLTVMPNTELLYIEYPDESVRTLSTSNETASVVAEKIGIHTAVMTNPEGGEYVDFFVHIPAGEVLSLPGGELSIDIDGEVVESEEKAISELWFWIVLCVLILILTEWGMYYHEQY